MKISRTRDNLAYEWQYVIGTYPLDVLYWNTWYSDHPMPTKPGIYLVSYEKRPAIFIVKRQIEDSIVGRTLSIEPSILGHLKEIYRGHDESAE